MKYFFQNFTMEQFKTFLLFLFIFTTVTTNTSILKTAKCPQICNCTQASDQCIICIEKQFNREFNQRNKTCPCLPNYQENYPPIDFCCSKNCSTCYSQGCFQCRSNWTKTLIRTNYVCNCKENYQYEQLLNDCICKSDIFTKSSNSYQQNFYSPSRFQCYRCGFGCQCNASGCHTCDEDANREIKISTSNVWTCFCKFGYTEVQNRTCIKQKLICTGNRILINNKCVCTQPYYQSGNSCICKSNLNPTSYYMYYGKCYICPSLCKCNKFGCVHCSIQARRNIFENNCSCDTSKGIVQIDGQCICISPYDSLCACNSLNYPLEFFQNAITKECLKCPYKCECNQTACLKCDPSTKRNSSGECIPPLIQLDDLCIGCPKNFIYVDKSCFCPTELYLQNKNYQLLFYDQQTITCNNCPIGCKCNIIGCIQCDSSLNRKIIQNKYGISTCYCNVHKNVMQNSLGLCECIFPYTYNSTIGNCSCQQPYFFNATGHCICKSSQTPTKYYLTENGCKPCPIQCHCSDIGCYQCSSKTGRAIIKENSLYLNFICPCFPIDLNEKNGYCTGCQLNQYLWKNQCIDCDSSCQTCDEYGCLSCKSTMQLQNNKCFCLNNQTFNGNQCICAKGNFLDIKSENCFSCPENCQNCQLNLDFAGMIECIQCKMNLFRKNDSTNNCPCMDYYTQGLKIYPYCCHWSCNDCNISGCISCLPFTFRDLNTSNPNNVTCSCKSGFIESYSTFCQCPKGTYLYIDQCLACPGHCLECEMTIIHVLNCTVCADGFNRKLSQNFLYHKKQQIQILNCICDERYIPYANSSYCYPRGCIQMSTKGICKKCDANRTISQQGKHCNCSVGFYTDYFYDCQPCNLNCIKCLSYDICTVCNTSNNSYLVQNKESMQIECIIPDHNKSILVQNRGNFILQFQNYFTLISEMHIYLILLNHNKQVNTHELKIIKFKNLTQGFFMAQFTDLYQNQVNGCLLYINTTAHAYSGYFLIKDGIYINQTLKYPYVQSIFIRIFIAFIMVASLILNILGQKSNQLMYYCQTVYFVAMNVKDSYMYVVPFLNYFRITTFNFNFNDSESPFNRIITDWTLFIENCDGNYKYFSMDNNLIRNVGLALYLNIQTIFFSTVFRIIYYLLYKSKYKPLLKKYKKAVYRSIEWMYKVTMYPLIFFSISTVINYNNQYSIINQQFRFLNLTISIIILAYYTVITAMQIKFEDISKIHRYDIAIQYIFNIINSVIIVYSVYNWLIFLLILPMFFKSILQYTISRQYMLKITQLYTYINILNFLSCSVIIAIYFNNKISTITLILSYIFGNIIMRIILIKIKHIHYKFEKKQVASQESKEIQSIPKLITEIHQTSQTRF